MIIQDRGGGDMRRIVAEAERICERGRARLRWSRRKGLQYAGQKPCWNLCRLIEEKKEGEWQN